PLVDADMHMFGVFSGQPHDPNWQKDITEPAAKLMDKAALNLYDRCAAPEPRHRRTHRSKSMGSSMGGRQQFPMHFFLTALQKTILTRLLAQKPFQHITGFANSIFQCFAPDLHAYYGSTIDKLHEWNPSLKWNFAADISVFVAAMFNFGPRTVTFPHIDFANLAWGWCAITALGDFNPDKGSHLILW
ncbi:hypothetical protein DFH08DRAFT_614266, partial [Mycena albidolilacea]